MIRLAIIDNDTHTLYVDDVPQEEIDKCGGEQEYIDEYYALDNYSWDYIVDAAYYPMGQEKPKEIDFSKI